MSKYIDGTLTVYFDNSNGNLTVPGTLAIGLMSTGTSQTRIVSTLVLNTSTVLANNTQSVTVNSQSTIANSIAGNTISSGVFRSGTAFAGFISTPTVSVSSITTNGRLQISSIRNDETLASGFLHYNPTTSEVVYNSVGGGGGGGGGVIVSASTLIGTNSVIAPTEFFAQELYTTTAFDVTQFGQSFFPASQSLYYVGIAISASGQYILACDNGNNSTGYLWLSSNFGSSFQQVGSQQSWARVAMNATGQIQMAAIGGPANGKLYQSTDYGQTWTLLSGSPITFCTKLAVSASGQYMSIADNTSGFLTNGNVYTSSNFGISWTLNTTAPTIVWKSIAMSASGQYQTACAYGGSIWRSTDYGGNWTTTGVANNSYYDVSMSASGQYQTVAAIGGTGNLYVSLDYGVTWTTKGTLGTAYAGVAMSASGQYQMSFVNGGSVYQSINYGQTWTTSSAPSKSWYDVAMSAAGNITALAANDPSNLYINSLQQFLPSPQQFLNPLITEEFTVAVGTNGGANSWIAYSHDGQNWIRNDAASNLFSSFCFGVAWNGILWIATGYGTNSLATSPDGINWTANSSALAQAVYIRSVAWNGSMWVAVGVSNPNQCINYSYDGLTWYPSANGTAIFGSTCFNVAWNGVLWVAGGSSSSQGIVGYSYNGINWNQSSSATGLLPVGTLTGLLWGGGLWITGCGNVIIRSSDGINWTVSDNSLFSGGNVGSFAYNGVIYIATGSYSGGGMTATSTDGITWTANSTLNTLISGEGKAAVWNGSLWIVTGANSINAGVVVTSPDGINWTVNQNASNIFVQGAHGIANRKVLPMIGTIVTPQQASTFSTLITSSLTTNNIVVSSIKNSGSFFISSLRSDPAFTTGLVHYNNATNELIFNDSGGTQSTISSFQNLFTSSLGINCNAPQYALDVNGTGDFLSTLSPFANFSTANVSTANISTAFISSAQVGSLGTSSLTASSFTTIYEAAAIANLSTANVSTANISTANISTGQVRGLTVSSLTVSSIASYFEAPVIASISTANISTANISTAFISSAQVGNASVGTDTISTANISTANISTANISTGQVRGLGVSSLTASSIASYFEAPVIASISTANISTANISTAFISSAQVGNAIVGTDTISTANISTANISTANISTGQVRGLGVSSLTVSSITAYSVAPDLATISTANISTANISTALISSAQMGSVNVGTDTISTANISTANISTANISTAQVRGLTASSLATSSIIAYYTSNVVANISSASISTAQVVTLITSSILNSGAAFISSLRFDAAITGATVHYNSTTNELVYNTTGGGAVSTVSTFTNLYASTFAAGYQYSWHAVNGTDLFSTNTVNSLAISTSAFTMECFYYPTATPPQPNIRYTTIMSLGTQPNTDGHEFRISGNANGGLGFVYPNGVGTTGVGCNIGFLTNSNWYHLALVRSGTNLTLYSNGSTFLTTAAVSYSQVEASKLILFSDQYAAQSTVGYMNSARVVLGQALYTGNFNIPTQQLTTTSVGTTGSNVAASLTGRVAFLGAVTSTFIDTGPSNLAVSAQNTATSALFSPYYGYLNVLGSNIGINCNSPQYTLDVYGIANLSSAQIGSASVGTDTISTANISTANISTALISSAQVGNASVGTATISTANISTANISTANISTGQVRGLGVSSLTVSSIVSNFEAPVIASISTANISTANISTANISTIQAVNLGVSSLTASSITSYSIAPVVATISTAFISTLTTLTTQANSLTTINISPVSNPYSWRASGTGNSDFIRTSALSNLNISSGLFTLECYFNPTGTPTFWGTILSLNNGSGTQGNEFRITQRNGGGGFGFLYPLTSGSADGNMSNGTTILPINSWYHIALVRSSANSLTLYSNGTALLITNSVNYSQNQSMRFEIFANPYNDCNAQGYINSARFTMGQALYTGNFTPPVQQLNSISVGTSGANVATSITGTVAFLGGVTSTLTDSGPYSLALTSGGAVASALVTPSTFSTSVVVTGGGLTLSSLTASSIVSYFEAPVIASISTANISTANISTAFISSAQVGNASVGTATISTANISTANISTANISTGQVRGLGVSSLTASSIASYYEAPVIASISTANISTANISTANISTIQAVNLGVSSLTASSITSYSIAPVVATISTANISSANISSVLVGMVPAVFAQSFVQVNNTSQVNYGSAMSSNGQYQLVGTNNNLYVSSNFGGTWTARGLSKTWVVVAVSGTGDYMYACDTTVSTGNLYKSTDYGTTWAIASAALPLGSWNSVAVSSSGQYVLALGPSFYYLSSNYGATFSQIASYAANNGVAISSTGQYMILGTATNITFSSNFGSTWATKTPGGGGGQAAAISGTGQYQLAGNTGNTLYLSSDYGATFAAIAGLATTAAYWTCAIDYTGQYQVTGQLGTNIYYSVNYGVTWTLATNYPNPSQSRSVSISANAQYILAPNQTGYFYGYSAITGINTQAALISTAFISSAIIGTIGNLSNITFNGYNNATAATFNSYNNASTSAQTYYIKLPTSTITGNPGNASTFTILGYNGTDAFTRNLFTIQPNGSIGIGGCNSPQYTLDVNGTINASVGVRSNATFLTSDRRIKEFITDADLDICYSNVKNLSLRRYAYISTFKTTKIDGSQIGFIADEVSSIFPKSVKDFPTTVDPQFSTIQHMNYDQIFLAHYGATQKLMTVVEDQTAKLAQQSTQMAQLLADNSTLTSMCSFIPQLMNTVSTLKG